jgi:hypothetical protein
MSAMQFSCWKHMQEVSSFPIVAIHPHHAKDNAPLLHLIVHLRIGGMWSKKTLLLAIAVEYQANNTILKLQRQLCQCHFF